jgi:inhibitor of KinA sporulation pathway (predicted exonuclease)
MNMQPQLLAQRISIRRKTVHLASHLERCLEQFVLRSPKHFPRQLRIAVRGNLHDRRRSLFGQRRAECPPAEHVPVLDAGVALERYKLPFTLFRDP